MLGSIMYFHFAKLPSNGELGKETGKLRANIPDLHTENIKLDALIRKRLVAERLA